MLSNNACIAPTHPKAVELKSGWGSVDALRTRGKKSFGNLLCTQGATKMSLTKISFNLV